MHEDPNIAAVALELGHVGFVLKLSGGGELFKAIDYILRGQSYLTPQLRPVDWVAGKARVRQFSKDLTKRQRDVVQLFAEGRAVKEIASILNLSEKTIQFHKYHIMQAFNIKNNAGVPRLVRARPQIDQIAIQLAPAITACPIYGPRQRPVRQGSDWRG